MRINDTNLREQQLNPIPKHLVALGAAYLTGLSDLFELSSAIRTCANPRITGKSAEEFADRGPERGK